MTSGVICVPSIWFEGDERLAIDREPTSSSVFAALRFIPPNLAPGATLFFKAASDVERLRDKLDDILEVQRTPADAVARCRYVLECLNLLGDLEAAYTAKYHTPWDTCMEDGIKKGLGEKDLTRLVVNRMFRLERG